MPNKFLNFVQQVSVLDSNHNRKTSLWTVSTILGDTPLGEVRWFNAWRKYCFFPQPATIYDAGCLEEIASFCDSQTFAHREHNRQQKLGMGL